jgi:hypothetical protein
MTSGVLDFLQGAYSETIAGLAKAFIGPSYDPTKAYIINGLRATSTGGGTSFTEGLVLFNNEVFYSPAQSVAPFIAPNVLIANIQPTFPVSGEPLTYQDGSTHNTCQRRWVDMASGASGSGSIADYSSMRRVLQPSVGYEAADMTVAFATTEIGFYENFTGLYGTTGSGPTITLNSDMAVDGCCVKLIVPAAGAGDVITFAFTGTIVTSPIYNTPLRSGLNEITVATSGVLTIYLESQIISGDNYVLITTVNN